LVGEQGFLHNAYYAERPWMPLVMFKVAPVRAALAAGVSFVDQVVFNDFVSRGLLTKAARRFGLRVPSLLRERYNGLRPELVFYDTGGAIYEELRFRKEQLFAGMPARFAPRYATHFWGVSRHVVQGGGTPVDTIAARYCASIPGGVPPPSSGRARRASLLLAARTSGRRRLWRLEQPDRNQSNAATKFLSARTGRRGRFGNPG